MLPYTPYTSESLTNAGAAINDLSSFADVTAGLPTGKQVIFFTIGVISIIASIALISRALLDTEITPELITKLAATA